MIISKNLVKPLLFLGFLVVISGGENFQLATGIANAQTNSVQPPSSPSSNLTIIYVNPNTGNDADNGSQRSPLRTITNALNKAQENSNTIIQLGQGNYTAANGEVFPIRLKSGVIIRGNEESKGNGIAIAGGGNYLSANLNRQNIAILAANQAELRGVTITNSNSRGYGVWIESASPIIANNTFVNNSQDGALVTGNSSALISRNVFLANSASNISIEATARPQIRGNILQQASFGISIKQNAEPLIAENTISNNQDGVLVQTDAKPIFRNNLIEKNQRNGLLILQNSRPDLGSPNDLGNNVFAMNGKYDLQNATNNLIVVAGNQISSQKISGKLQLIASKLTNNSASDLEISRTQPNQANFIKPISSNIPVANPQLLSNLEAIPNSVIVRISANQSNNPVPTNTAIASNLPPIFSRPPAGDAVNQPIVIAPKSGLTPSSFSTARYRVIVPVVSEASNAQIRRVVPNAFPSRSRGQLVLQVGAYSDRLVADSQVRKLKDAGFNAAIELIER